MTKLAIDKFKNDIRFREKIAHIETIPGKEARYKKVANLEDKILKYLEKNNIKLYEHQALAIEKIRENKNIIITTPTASGKTLAFNLPVLETLIKDKNACALYIYPAKALAHDQLDVLKRFEEGLDINIKPHTYDGDTPKSDRYQIRQESRVILSNPYQLHHILAWHHQWKRFYSNLKYIIIDEAHYYKGIFGSNVAFLIRRLKRIANFYGSNPQFILSSATLANPIELAEKLTGESFDIIDEDTSPSGDKDFILYNPYQKKYSKKSDAPSIHQETETIFLYLLLKDIQTLCFTVSRKIAELIAMWAKNDMFQYKRKWANRITAYRAGYLANERREIETGLKERKYLGVTCTNALELGINIGTLDAVVISGYPGSMISVWQQGGRSGRGNQKSLVILVAFENQLDQYFMNNPDFFFDKAHENAVLDLNNEILINNHIICATNELPVHTEEAKELFNADEKFLNNIVKNRDIAKNPAGIYSYPYDDSPSFDFSLDQLSTEVFKIMNGNQLLEKMEKSQVYREAHEGAVLINKGQSYIVNNVNFKNHYVNVSKKSVSYHTTVLKDTDIKIKNKIKREKIGDFTVHFGELEVMEDFHRYKKMEFSKTVGTYILDLPPLKFTTKGIWFTVPEYIKNNLEDNYDEKDVFAGGLHGTEHALIGLFPLHVMCDRFDIGGLSTNYHEDTQEATIFIYDAYEGGIGITEKAIDVFKALAKSTNKLLKTCKCKNGCPSCIYSPKCGNENKPLHKKATEYILDYICEEINKPSFEELNSIEHDSVEDLIYFDENSNTSDYKSSVAISSDNTNSSELAIKSNNINSSELAIKSNNINSSELAIKSNNINSSELEIANFNTKSQKVASAEIYTETKREEDLWESLHDENNNSEEEFNNEIKLKYKEALANYKDEKYFNAKNILEDIIAMDKNYSNALYLLGDIRNKEGYKEEAINYLKKAIKIDPGHEDANELFMEISK